MNGRAFLDTNILIYVYSENEPFKRNVACDILNNYDCLTSIQALNEASNVWFRKCGLTGIKIKEYLDNIELVCDKIVIVGKNTIEAALALKDRYGYSYYDCLMLAFALEHNCTVILTEDMNDSQNNSAIKNNKSVQHIIYVFKLKLP